MLVVDDLCHRGGCLAAPWTLSDATTLFDSIHGDIQKSTCEEASIVS